MSDRISQTFIYKIQNLPSVQLSNQAAHLTNFMLWFPSQPRISIQPQSFLLSQNHAFCIKVSGIKLKVIYRHPFTFLGTSTKQNLKCQQKGTNKSNRKNAHQKVRLKCLGCAILRLSLGSDTKVSRMKNQFCFYKHWAFSLTQRISLTNSQGVLIFFFDIFNLHLFQKKF